MSRIGKKPVSIPEGVKVTFKDHDLMVEGPLGMLSQRIHSSIKVEINDKEVLFHRRSNKPFDKALHGLYRSLVFNMVEGVTKGFQKALEIQGVGYRAAKEGKGILLQLGFSHPVSFQPPEGVELIVEKPTVIVVKGIDKHLVGQVAASIRGMKKPDAYKGKGIRYVGEYVKTKVGKGAGR